MLTGKHRNNRITFTTQPIPEPQLGKLQRVSIESGYAIKKSRMFFFCMKRVTAKFVSKLIKFKLEFLAKSNI